MSIWTTNERQQLRKSVRAFAEREILPHMDEWEQAGELPRELSRKAAAAGLLGIGFPEEVGGEGGDAADTAIVAEELHEAGTPGGVFASPFRTLSPPAISDSSTPTSNPRCRAS